MSSAQHLTEINIWVKFNENRSKGSADMEQAQISRVNPMTLKCDLDLESVKLKHGLCSLFH